MEYRVDLGTAKVIVTNFHAFMLREPISRTHLTHYLKFCSTPEA
jgi:hypothetical protein